ncbi:hypothetical protein CYMTET_39933 [Cymbomonas tetramitiformis]|uniref:Uncharacterized protein n=1 Tax=Cymbomonas tetramitiformis TaxID=36881 RepID=A0AAE0F472_9CHLO|nr:hypothetical protein CYMTET_39933 [Cymbomonas tetramitiformis]
MTTQVAASQVTGMQQECGNLDTLSGVVAEVAAAAHEGDPLEEGLVLGRVQLEVIGVHVSAPPQIGLSEEAWLDEEVQNIQEGGSEKEEQKEGETGGDKKGEKNGGKEGEEEDEEKGEGEGEEEGEGGGEEERTVKGEEGCAMKGEMGDQEEGKKENWELLTEKTAEEDTGAAMALDGLSEGQMPQDGEGGAALVEEGCCREGPWGGQVPLDEESARRVTCTDSGTVRKLRYEDMDEEEESASPAVQVVEDAGMKSASPETPVTPLPSHDQGKLAQDAASGGRAAMGPENWEPGSRDTPEWDTTVFGSPIRALRSLSPLAEPPLLPRRQCGALWQAAADPEASSPRAEDRKAATQKGTAALVDSQPPPLTGKLPEDLVWGCGRRARAEERGSAPPREEPDVKMKEVEDLASVESAEPQQQALELARLGVNDIDSEPAFFIPHIRHIRPKGGNALFDERRGVACSPPSPLSVMPEQAGCGEERGVWSPGVGDLGCEEPSAGADGAPSSCNAARGSRAQGRGARPARPTRGARLLMATKGEERQPRRRLSRGEGAVAAAGASSAGPESPPPVADVYGSPTQLALALSPSPSPQRAAGASLIEEKATSSPGSSRKRTRSGLGRSGAETGSGVKRPRSILKGPAQLASPQLWAEACAASQPVVETLTEELSKIRELLQVQAQTATGAAAEDLEVRLAGVRKAEALGEEELARMHRLSSGPRNMSNPLKEDCA